MINILHITPHLGGGVGTVVRNYLKNENNHSHKIFSLDTLNDLSKDTLIEHNIFFKDELSNKHEEILNELSNSDIIIIHWWNHPLLYELLIKNSFPESRIIIWSHISGNSLPNIFTDKLFDYPDYFVFTTPMSFLTNEYIQYKKSKDKFYHVWSTGGIEHLKNIPRYTNKKEFVIGYIGTLDYSKLYNNFIGLLSKIKIPNVKFIICGDGADKKKIQEEVSKKNLTDKFIFTGYVNDITEYLPYFDVFCYPLNSSHYGTCDQVIAETMSCGIIPIVFNNNMESYMVHHLYSGIVVDNEQRYIEYVEKIYYNPSLKKLLENNAKIEASLRFSIDKTISEWEYLFKKILSLPKTKKRWQIDKRYEDIKPHEIFLEAIGKYNEIFKRNDKEEIKKFLEKNQSWNSPTKGTIKHYLSFFNDEILEQWNQNE